jgi:hypothetical protein
MFVIQVYIPKNMHDAAEKPEWHWTDVCPTGQPRYEFESREKALKMMQMCYPQVLYAGTTRVVRLPGRMPNAAS